MLLAGRIFYFLLPPRPSHLHPLGLFFPSSVLTRSVSSSIVFSRFFYLFAISSSFFTSFSFASPTYYPPRGRQSAAKNFQDRSRRRTIASERLVVSFDPRGCDETLASSSTIFPNYASARNELFANEYDRQMVHGSLKQAQ